MPVLIISLLDIFTGHWLAKSGRIAYSGALEPVDKEDEGPHGYMEGEVTAKGVG